MFKDVTTVSDLLSLTKEQYGDKIAFSYFKDKEKCSVSYSELSKQVTAAAKSLVLKGITNSKIALASENSYYCLLWGLAIPLSGNVLVILDNNEKLLEKVYRIEHSEAICLIYSSFNQPLCDHITENNPNVIHKISLELDTKYCINTESGIVLTKTDGTELSYIFYTSGTTGKPKGVMHSQINILRSNFYFSYSLKIEGSTVLILPLSHITAFANVVLAPMYKGVNTFISSGLKDLLMEIKEVKPYYIFVVPAILAYFDKTIDAKAQEIIQVNKEDNLIARKKALKDIFGENLKMFIMGGAVINIDVAKHIQELDILVLNGYGLTETCGSITVNLCDDNRLGSLGKINFNSKGKTIDGELVFKNPYLFLGYYKNPDATAEVFDDKWFLSGDLGYIEDDYVYFTGRKKNLIVLANGENVNPEEIELELLKIEEVIEVIVCEENGKLTAKVYSEGDQSLIRKKINEINRNLTSYKQIENVIFQDEEFPKTSSKKIKRGDNRDA